MQTTSATAQAAHILVKFRAMQPSKRFTAFKKLDKEMQTLITEPCRGEAHSNAHIDGCSLCLNYSWGRTLKRLETV